MTFYIKDPDAELDYINDWSEWLAANPQEDGGPGWVEGDDTITAVTWTVPDGITEGEDTHASSFTDRRSTVWLSGGTLGEIYEIVTHVTTADGRIDDRSDHIYIQNR